MMLQLFTLACSTCRSAPAGAAGRAAEWSIFVLFCIIVTVLGAVAYSMVRLAKRSRQFADPTLSDEWTSEE